MLHEQTAEPGSGSERWWNLLRPIDDGRRAVVHDGTLEALKWLALILMTVDHVNGILFHHQVGWMYQLGRPAMPIFMFVLAYNLARPTDGASAMRHRMLIRMGAMGVMATPAYVYATHGSLLSLNIMFTMAVLVILYGRWLRAGARFEDRWICLLMLLGLGIWVEYLWFGLILGMACIAYVRRRTRARLGILFLAMLLLSLLNVSLWTLLALPLMVMAPALRLPVPRLPGRVFYWYYPLHLSVLAAIHYGWGL